MPNIAANGIQIEYEDFGSPDAPPILLIMGLGVQLTMWPIEFVDALVARGFRVIRYDNRDVGLSSKLDGAGVPNVQWLMLKTVLGIKSRTPYSLSDMASDAVGLLDALGIQRAHVVGASMGGMIAQRVAIEHSDRVLTMTSIMSTTGNKRLPRARPEAMKMLTNRPKTDSREELIAFSIRAARVIGSPAYPMADDRLEARVRGDYARSYYPQGFGRQLAAIIADGDRRPLLQNLSVPTLVIHGEDDPLVPIEGGRDTAANIPGASLLTIPGMGHDVPLQLVDQVADAIAGHANQVPAVSAIAAVA